MTMGMDNEVVIRQSGNEESSRLAKHIDIKLNFIMDYAQKGVVQAVYIPTKAITADLLKEAFSAAQLLDLI